MKSERIVPSITQAEIEAAVIKVIGESVFKNLNDSHGLVACHERACMRAFMDGLTGDHIEILRVSMKFLSDTGVYPHYYK